MRTAPLRRALAVSLCCAAAFAQGHVPLRVAWLPAAQVAERAADQASPWLPLLDTPTLALGRYRLRAGQADAQAPHARDEVYHVVAGRAQLQVGEEVRPVAAGDTVFVAARVPHRFVAIEQDLDVLVFFSSARAPTGGMAVAAPPTEQTPYAETSQRGSARIFYWFGPDSAGQVALDFGQPRWRPAFAKFLDEPAGQRWRFGENFWTSLDTNMPLRLGGVDVPVGQYYVVLQNMKDAGLQLVLLDPQAVRARRLDAYEAGKTSGGILVPLVRAKADGAAVIADRLEVELSVDGGKRDRGELTIRFGPNVLTAPLVLVPFRG